MEAAKAPIWHCRCGKTMAKTVEEWMLNDGGVERIFGISQLFVKSDKHGAICLLVAKVTDDFLLGSTVQQTEMFVRDLNKRFEVGKVLLNAKIHFDGCEIEQNMNGSIRVSMFRYLERLNPITLSRTRRKQKGDRATECELK